MDSQTRQEYVRAAVSFLQNPKLVDSSLKDKLKFLRDKGLSDVEVDEALNLALVNRHQSHNGRWNFILVLGLCIGGHKLYQAYLESKAKQANQKQDTTNRNSTKGKSNLFQDVRAQSQSVLEARQPSLNDILDKMAELKKLIELQRSIFGTEIQSLKTLLLGHEKFAAPPKIPEWQLKDDKKEKEEAKDQEKDSETEKIKKGRQKKSEKKTGAPADNGFIEPPEIVPNHG